MLDSISKKTSNAGTQQVAILGGGVAGLSTYFFLKKAGFTVHVYERSDYQNNDGMGFLMLENGVQVIQEMGLEHQFAQVSRKLNRYETFSDPLHDSLDANLDGVYGVKRSDLVRVLRSVVPQEDIVLNAELDQLIFDEKGIAKTALMKDGTEVQADIFITADGVFSSTRQTLFPESSLQSTNNHEIVGVLPKHRINIDIGDAFAKYVNSIQGLNMGMFQLADGDLLWFMQVNTDIHGAYDTTYGTLEEYIKGFSTILPEPFYSVLMATDLETCYYWKTNRHDLLPSFHKENVVLIGDAAHPLLTFTSQGVNAALTDAKILSEKLAMFDQSLENRLGAFYAERKVEISQFIQQGDQLLEQFSNAKLQGIPLVC